jgi:hypothetical protein
MTINVVRGQIQILNFAYYNELSLLIGIFIPDHYYKYVNQDSIGAYTAEFSHELSLDTYDIVSGYLPNTDVGYFDPP